MKKRLVTAAALTLATAMMLGGCGGSQGQGEANNAAKAISADEISKVLNADEEIDLTLWGWSKSQYEPALKLFEQKHPKIKVHFVTGTINTDMYSKYQNAVDAKTGIPDVMQWEYSAIPQYAASGTLLNFGSKSVESQIGSKYNKTAWADSHYAGGLYGIPSDQGPTVMFYRQDILDQYGLKVPATWKEFEETGKALHKADPSKYLAYLPMDLTSQPFTNMLTYANAKPWNVEGKKNVTLDMQNEKVHEVSDFMQRCIQEGVFKPVSDSGEDFSKGLAAGEFASGIRGVWFADALRKQYTELNGKWRVTLPPVWGDDDTQSQSYNAVNGGSAFVVSSFSSRKKQVAALALADWLGSDPVGLKSITDNGLFAAANAYQSDKSLADVTDPYFGGQKVNETFFRAADAVKHPLPALPFMQEMDTTYKDDVLPTLTNGNSIFKAVGKWQNDVDSWAKDQGFTVTVK